MKLVFHNEKCWGPCCLNDIVKYVWKSNIYTADNTMMYIVYL